MNNFCRATSLLLLSTFLLTGAPLVASANDLSAKVGGMTSEARREQVYLKACEMALANQASVRSSDAIDFNYSEEAARYARSALKPDKNGVERLTYIHPAFTEAETMKALGLHMANVQFFLDQEDPIAALEKWMGEVRKLSMSASLSSLAELTPKQREKYEKEHLAQQENLKKALMIDSDVRTKYNQHLSLMRDARTKAAYGTTGDYSPNLAKDIHDTYKQAVEEWADNAVAKCGATKVKNYNLGQGSSVRAPARLNLNQFTACAGLEPRMADYEKGGSKYSDVLELRASKPNISNAMIDGVGRVRCVTESGAAPVCTNPRGEPVDKNGRLLEYINQPSKDITCTTTGRITECTNAKGEKIDQAGYRI